MWKHFGGGAGGGLKHKLQMYNNKCLQWWCWFNIINYWFCCRKSDGGAVGGTVSTGHQTTGGTATAGGGNGSDYNGGANGGNGTANTGGGAGGSGASSGTQAYASGYWWFWCNYLTIQLNEVDNF